MAVGDVTRVSDLAPARNVELEAYEIAFAHRDGHAPGVEVLPAHVGVIFEQLCGTRAALAAVLSPETAGDGEARGSGITGGETQADPVAAGLDLSPFDLPDAEPPLFDDDDAEPPSDYVDALVLLAELHTLANDSSLSEAVRLGRIRERLEVAAG